MGGLLDEKIDTGSLRPIPPEACLHFHRSMGTLIDEVNSEMEGRADLAQLIGAGNLSLMRDNHNNHAAFMDNVFFLGNYTLLASVIPWVYRVYAARGFSLDYFPTELQAWSRAIQAHLPAPLAEPILAVYAWMIQHHPLFAGSAETPPSLEGPQVPPVALNPFLESAIKGDSGAVERLAREALGEKPSLEALYLWILEPLMREIGRRWEQAMITSAQEHIASALVTRMMSVAYAKFETEPLLGKRAVVCTGPHEQHQIGAWMVSDLLELRGWDARLLGANPSPEDLLALLDEFRPALLCLSVTMPFHLRDAVQFIETLRKHANLSGLKIMVGGQAFALDPALPERIGADGWALDARSAALLAEQWWGDRTK